MELLLWILGICVLFGTISSIADGLSRPKCQKCRIMLDENNKGLLCARCRDELLLNEEQKTNNIYK